MNDWTTSNKLHATRQREDAADESIREAAAEALDLTLDADGRGPRTFTARRRVAEALDLGRRPRAADVLWLQTAAMVSKGHAADGDSISGGAL